MSAVAWSAIGLLALVLLGAGGALIVRARTRLRAQRAAIAARASVPPAPQPRPIPEVAQYPLVLAHGWMGFDAIAVAGRREEYFRGVKAHLERQGHRVFVPRVAPIASIQRRAEELANRIDALGFERVNIVAHSMGGLDARYAIGALGLGNRVASLTTLGTPHHGTPLANSTLRLEQARVARHLLGRLGVNLAGVSDLSVERMARFNLAVPDDPEVEYSSFVGWVRRDSPYLHRLLAPCHSVVSKLAGDNDGIVPMSSQRWGHVHGEVHADHWAQIGWSRGLDVPEFYAQLAKRLAARGF